MSKGLPSFHPRKFASLEFNSSKSFWSTPSSSSAWACCLLANFLAPAFGADAAMSTPISSRTCRGRGWSEYVRLVPVKCYASVVPSSSPLERTPPSSIASHLPNEILSVFFYFVVV